MCFYYFSDALGLSFGAKNEEVYHLDQIKEWDPPEAKWLVPPDLLGSKTIKKKKKKFFFVKLKFY